RAISPAPPPLIEQCDIAFNDSCTALLDETQLNRVYQNLVTKTDRILQQLDNLKEVVLFSKQKRCAHPIVTAPAGGTLASHCPSTIRTTESDNRAKPANDNNDDARWGTTTSHQKNLKRKAYLEEEIEEPKENN